MPGAAELAQAVFWLSLAAIAFAIVGFPILIGLRAWLAPLPPARSAEAELDVSVVIAAHNEEGRIAAKLANLRSLAYPRERLQIIVASDGSTDRTVGIVRAEAASDARLQILDLPRNGKNRALNHAFERCTGEIVIFTDCDTLLDPDCLRHLLAPFADPQVGGCGGDFRYCDPKETGEESGDDPVAGVEKGERLYWSYDRLWKRMQSRAGNMTSATGQIYAIRRSLVALVPDGVTDDFFQSTGVIEAGYRLVFCPLAIGRGPAATSAGAEFRRKVRVSARGLASVWERRALLNPLRFGFYALQLASHKVFRRLVGLPVILLFLSSAWIVATSAEPPRFVSLALIAQLAFHATALLGWLIRDLDLRGSVGWLRVPLYFDLVNAAALIAAGEVLAGKRYRTWSPERGA